MSEGSMPPPMTKAKEGSKREKVPCGLDSKYVGKAKNALTLIGSVMPAEINPIPKNAPTPKEVMAVKEGQFSLEVFDVSMRIKI